MAAGRRPLRTLFSDDQERLIRDYGPIGITWHELSVLGPVEVHMWELKPSRFPYKVTIEQWVLPDHSDLVELSIKAPPNQAADAHRAFHALLVSRGLDTGGDQHAKARTVLEFFTSAHGSPPRHPVRAPHNTI